MGINRMKKTAEVAGRIKSKIKAIFSDQNSKNIKMGKKILKLQKH